jgi:hypothetical protein
MALYGQWRFERGCHDIRHEDIEYDDTQHNNKNVAFSITTIDIMRLNIKKQQSAY